MPELKGHLSRDLIGRLAGIAPDAHLRLALLFADCPPEAAEAWLRGSKFDNDTVRTVPHLIRFAGFPFAHDAAGIRRAVCTVGQKDFPALLQLLGALGRIPDIGAIEGKYQKILAAGDCVSLKQLAVTGADLIAAGIRPGPEMGKILQRLLDAVLEDPALNQKEKLLRMV